VMDRTGEPPGWRDREAERDAPRRPDPPAPSPGRPALRPGDGSLPRGAARETPPPEPRPVPAAGAPGAVAAPGGGRGGDRPEPQDGRERGPSPSAGKPGQAARDEAPQRPAGPISRSRVTAAPSRPVPVAPRIAAAPPPERRGAVAGPAEDARRQPRDGAPAAGQGRTRADAEGDGEAGWGRAENATWRTRGGASARPSDQGEGRSARESWRGRLGLGRDDPPEGAAGKEFAGKEFAGEGEAPRRPRRMPLAGGEEPGVRTVPREDRFSRRRELRRVVRGRRAVLPSRQPGEDDEEEGEAPAGPLADAPAGPAAATPPAADEPPAEPRAPPPAGRAADPLEEPSPEPPVPTAAGLPEAEVAAPPIDRLEAPAAPERRDASRQSRPAGRKAPVEAAPPPEGTAEEGPLVSPDTVAARGLAVVVAIMTFLSAVLTGGAVLVDRAADAWSVAVLDEISVSVLPRDGDPVEPRLEAVARALRATEGLSAVRVVPQTESDALLEPWLGTDVDLSILPVPRLVTAERTGPLDVDALQLRLAAISGATLDDHEGWSRRLSEMAATVAAGAIAALLLMLLATALAIVFATRATIAANAATVEVLTILGAEERYIVRVFRRRFLATGLRGAAAGLGVAVLLFASLEVWAALSPQAASAQARALFGDPSIGLFGYGALAAVGLAVAALVAVTSSLAVRRHLDRLTP